MKINKSKLSTFLLLAVAIIWGSGFIATEYAIKSNMPTSLIMTLRFTIASLVMGVASFKDLKYINKESIIVGTIAGVLLFIGFFSQTYGQAFTNVSSSAFLTSTNVVMIPFIVWIITKQRPSLKSFVLAFSTLIGIGFLTLKPSESIGLGKGEIFIVLCAIFFALHISYLGTSARKINPRILTFLQMFVAGICSLTSFLILDRNNITSSMIQNGLLPAVYLALFSTCLCYFLQTYSQQHVSASKAGIIMSMEGLFGTLFSIVLGLESLTSSIIIGGLIILLSVILMEVDIPFKINPSKS